MFVDHLTSIASFLTLILTGISIWVGRRLARYNSKQIDEIKKQILISFQNIEKELKSISGEIKILNYVSEDTKSFNTITNKITSIEKSVQNNSLHAIKGVGDLKQFLNRWDNLTQEAVDLVWKFSCDYSSILSTNTYYNSNHGWKVKVKGEINSIKDTIRCIVNNNSKLKLPDD